LVPWDYQASAARASIGRNTLLVLPTGLGKTIVALLHVQSILGSVQEGLCIMMAPTKALLVQHLELFKAHLGLGDAGLAIVDGETTPDNRRDFYKGLGGRRVVLFMTPQTVLHDLEKGRIPREWVVDIVVDEAHHATRGDPYALVYAYLREHGVSPRVLAMTASPGETEQRIVDVCQNLGINPADSIIKTRDDLDVAPHVYKLDVKRYAVDLTPEYEQVRAALVAVLREPCTWLESAGIAVGIEGISGDSLRLPSMQSLQALFEKHAPGMPARGALDDDEDPAVDPDPEPAPDVDPDEVAMQGPVVPASRWEVVSRLALAMKARHCVELVETQGFPALVAYHEKQVAKLESEPSKATVALLQHPQYRSALLAVGKLVSDGSPAARHPKLEALASVMEAFVREHPTSRCIVFTKYRASIPMLVAHLSGVKGVEARRFVGQGDASPKDKGMDRETQQAVLREFKETRSFNVLVATKAAEEGLDVADCDMVAFYEATASVIQFIQRQGRAGRRRDGTIAIMLANGTADQLNAAMLDEKLAAMPGIYYRVQRIQVSPRPAPRPVRKVAARQSISVNPGCFLASGIVAGLTAESIVARLDTAVPGDIALPGGSVVRVITTADAELWDAEITREELPGVVRPVLAVFIDDPAGSWGAMVSGLEGRLAGTGIEVWSFASAVELATLVVMAAEGTRLIPPHGADPAVGETSRS
jgi:Fanconi anemia group M protein